MTAFAGVSSDELHFVLLGVSGSGKSTLFKQLMCCFPHSDTSRSARSSSTGGSSRPPPLVPQGTIGISVIVTGETGDIVSSTIPESPSYRSAGPMIGMSSPPTSMGFTVSDLRRYKKHIRFQVVETCQLLINYARFAGECNEDADAGRPRGARIKPKKITTSGITDDEDKPIDPNKTSYDLIETLSYDDREYLSIPDEYDDMAHTVSAIRGTDDLHSFKDEIQTLWANVLNAWFVRRHELKLHVSDSAGYLMLSRLPDILGHTYQPTKEDVCKARHRTEGEAERCFNIESRQCVMHDVGGMASERKKTWAHVLGLPEICAAVFCVSLTSYCSYPFDDSQSDLMHSLAVWKRWVNDTGKFDKSKPFLLVLTHYDVLAASLKHEPFRKYVPEFKEENKVWMVAEYIKELFMTTIEEERHVSVFLINGTSETSVTNVFKRLIVKCEEIQTSAKKSKHEPPRDLL